MARRRRKRGPAYSETPRRRPLPVRWIIVAVVLVAAVAWGVLQFSDRSEPAPPPLEVPADLNLLLITMDTTRADALGCYGNDAADTPNLDRLAAEGTRFERCTACTPLTLPSHCTIHTGTNPLVHGVLRNGLSHLEPASVTLAEMLKDGGFATNAVVASFVLNARFGLDQGFDVYRNVVAERGTNPTIAERKGDEVCDDALGMLTSLATRRFFLWVHFYDPHYPYESPRHDDVGSPGAYADEVSFMDRQIGRLRAELESRGLADKTLVIAVGDHGEGLGDHGESQHGYLLYESDLHVPLIAWCPGVIPAGRVVPGRVRTVDIVPTALDLLGQPAPEVTQGVSLRPLLAGQADDLHLAAYGQSIIAQAELGLSPLHTLHAGDWKYILASTPELYDLASDPHELNNLSTQQPQRATELRQQLWTLVVDAPPSVAEQTAAPALSAADVARLASLGYVGSASGGAAPTTADLDAFEPTGENPAQRVADVEKYVVARRLLANQDYEGAAALLRDLALAFPQAPNPIHELARAWRRLGREDEIMPFCEQILQQDPQAINVRIFYAQRLLQDRQPEEAVTQLETAVAQEPDNGSAHFQLGNALRSLQRLDEARAHYERAVELDPGDISALHMLALVCIEQNQLALAAEHLRRLVQLEPNSVRFKQDLERVLRELDEE